MATLKKHRILILGVSGYLGNAIYKELHSYYQTFGTYKTPFSSIENNKHFFHYDFEEDDVFEILNVVKPTIIISALRGDFTAQLTAHKHVFEYISTQKNCKIIFLDRLHGVSKLNKGIIKEAILGVIKMRLKTILGRS